MKILFIQGGSRLKQDTEGNWYTDPNFNDDVWKRYVDLADSFTILLRKESTVYPADMAKERFNKMLDDPRIRIVPLPDFAETKASMINPLTYKKIKNIITEEVRNVDKCFIRSVSPYSWYTYQACKKFNKKYLFEACDFARESYAFHSSLGKLIAGRMEKWHIVMAHDAACATYVTGNALQERYPCASGKMLSCSNVQLPKLDDNVLSARLKKIDNKHVDDIIVIGTAAFLDVKWKGQDLVIKALGALKKKGITNIRFEMIGIGTGTYLRKIAKENNVLDQVKIIGPVRHDQVFPWLDSLDLYIQSSYQEGLCRSVIEALSRALPVICSDTGGNYELVEQKYIFDCGDYNTLSGMIEKILTDMPGQAKRNFNTAKKYEKSILDARRKAFFKEFIKM